MSAQFLVELRRLVHRQILAVFAVLVLAALAVAGLSIWATTGPEEVYYEYYDDSGFETLESTFCPSGLVTSQRAPGGALDATYLVGSCPEATPATIEQEVMPEGEPATYHPWNGSIAFFSVAALVVLWLLAASLIGEEFRHGTVETALVAEPRRARLLVLRLGAVLVVGLGAYVVAAAGFLLANVPAWVLHGVEGASVSPGALASAVGRGTLAAALVVLTSASLAVIGRGTLLSLGVLVGLAVLTAALFLFLKSLVPLEYFTNLYAVVTGGDGLRAHVIDEGPFTRTLYGGGWPWIATVVVIAGYTGAALAGAFATFTRRDVR